MLKGSLSRLFSGEAGMGHISVLRAMIGWGIGTLIAIVGAVIIGQQLMQTRPSISFIYGLLLVLSGLAVVIINQVVFKVRKTQLEIDSDETIKRLEKKIERLERAKESE